MERVDGGKRRTSRRDLPGMCVWGGGQRTKKERPIGWVGGWVGGSKDLMKDLQGRQGVRAGWGLGHMGGGTGGTGEGGEGGRVWG